MPLWVRLSVASSREHGVNDLLSAYRQDLCRKVSGYADWPLLHTDIITIFGNKKDIVINALGDVFSSVLQLEQMTT